MISVYTNVESDGALRASGGLVYKKSDINQSDTGNHNPRVGGSSPSSATITPSRSTIVPPNPEGGKGRFTGACKPNCYQPTIAALFVQTGGCYFGIQGVDPWDEVRDARLYRGPYAIVAHPPCQRWGKLWAGQPLWIKRTGQRKIKGDDGGCFKSALDSVREYGGVIEHPWQSHAWPHFGIPVPPRAGGWISTGDGGWTCCVEQGRYGHYARKPTLLVVYGIGREYLPELEWGVGERRLDPAVVERMGLKRAIKLGEVGGKGGGTDSSPRIGTPRPFQELLIGLARLCHKSGDSAGRGPEYVTKPALKSALLLGSDTAPPLLIGEGE